MPGNGRAFVSELYPWIKALHIMSVIAWMAGLFYLPRLYVYHVESEAVAQSRKTDEMLQVMERKLLRVIMNPAMIATWVFGLWLALTPGIVDWTAVWPYMKLAAILGMTWFHYWLTQRRTEFVAGTVARSGREFRLMNEVPTLLMVVIVISVVVRPF